MEVVYVCALVMCCGAVSAALCSTSTGKRLGELLKLDGQPEWRKQETRCSSTEPRKRPRGVIGQRRF